MYPHERSLVDSLKDRPFAIVGVNSDRNREVIRQRVEEEKINWRSFWDGSTSGPISTRWNVSAWPTIYVIDHKGIIRAKNVRGPALDTWVMRLLKEAEAETAGG